MMKRSFIIIAVAIIVIIAIAIPLGLFVTKDEVPCYAEFDGSEQCYEDKKDHWYRWYGPKTDYSTSTGLKDTNASEYVIPGCEPVMIYIYGRHSARFPDLGDLLKMSTVLHRVQNWTMEAAAQGKTKLCAKDIEQLRNWKQGYEFTDAALSTDQGTIDTHMIATRFKKMFPTLLPGEYSSQDYKFGYSNRDRTNQSLQAFAEIIFNETEFAKIEYPHADVRVVSFHKMCERKLWPNKTKIKREWFDEPERFRTSPVADRFVRNVKARLGIQDKEINYVDLRQIAVECAVSYTAFRGSPWCGVFSNDDLLVTEYDDDLYDYYKDSYGRPLNPKMGCPIVNEVTQLFSDAAEKPKEKHYKAVLYFSHSRDYKKLLSSFDLFNGDEPFTADAFCTERIRNRIWRAATFSPYSAQLTFVLFKCGETYKVLTLVNEKPVKLPRCSYTSNEMLCDVREFASKYRVKNCDVDKICTPSALNEKWPDSHWEDV